MKLWQRSAPKTSGDEYQRAIAKSSAEWAGEIRRLTDELDAQNVERAALTEAAGQAELDGHTAMAGDLTERLVRIGARESVIRAAITAAEARMADAEHEEQRRHLEAQRAEYYALLASYASASATVREAEYRLAEAVKARSDTVDVGRIGVLYDLLLAAGVGPPGLEELTQPGRSAEWLRAEAARLAAVGEGVPA